MKLKFIFRTFLNIIFFFGFAFSLVTFAIYPGWINAAVFAIYPITILITSISSKPKSWGKIRDKRKRNLVGYEIRLCIRSSDGSSIIIARTIINGSDGKYFLKATPGSYELNISDPGGQVIYTGLTKIEKYGVLNKNIVIS